MKVKEAKDIVGGLSDPSKMPSYGYSISALRCQAGAKLRKIKGSICSVCYALKGRYAFGMVQNALERRFKSLSDPRWVKAMTFLINRYESGKHFRWHDSGDIQSVGHLGLIVDVCKKTPTVTHWLPTREYTYVARYLKEVGALPKNLTVRLSAFMLDGPAPTAIAERLGLTTSGASKSNFNCPASNQGNQCLDCRACWNPAVANVNYRQH